MAIGAPNNDGNGFDSGSVTIYRLINSSWEQYGNILYGEAEYDYSGRAVCLNGEGSIVAIGSPLNDGNSIDKGSVRVFEINNGIWQQIGGDIDGEAMEDFSGESKTLAISDEGLTVAIGAIRNDGGGSDSGHVRIYHFDGNDWVKLGSDINGEGVGDYSGESVSINNGGNIVAIGTAFNDGNGSQSGHVRIFEYINGNWQQLGEDIDGENPNDQSGSSISLNGNGDIIAIAATSFRDDDNNVVGQVKMFKFNGIDWIQYGDMIIGEGSGESFGSSLSLNDEGNVVVIGATNSNNYGAVRIYTKENNNWIKVDDDIEGYQNQESFGVSVSINSSGSLVSLGASGNSDNGYSSGMVQVFENQILGVSSTQKNINIELYPNPTNNRIDVKTEYPCDLQVINSIGQIIFNSIRITAINTIIDLSNEAGGVYFF